MKFNVELDCTPEEARRLMGLPDLSALHRKYSDAVADMMDPSRHPEMVEALLRSWAPMGDAGMTAWRRMLDPGTRSD